MRWFATLLIIPLAAAAPQRGLSLNVPDQNPLLPVPPRPPPKPSRFEPAPLPNRDVEQSTPRATLDPSLSPTLFNRRDSYRGDGFLPGSTAQSETERRVRPGAGFNLKMPLAPK